MGHQPYKIERGFHFSDFLRHLNALTSKKGWEAEKDPSGKIRLTRPDSDDDHRYCPLIACSLQYFHTAYDGDYVTAGRDFNFSEEESRAIAAASDYGATVPEHGAMRYDNGWGFSSVVRCKLEYALDLIPWYKPWRFILAFVP